MNLEIKCKNLNFFECISSETRIKIIELLDIGPMNIKDIAKALNISSAIVTKHIQKMEEAGIITCETFAGKRGTQKICSLLLDEVILKFRNNKVAETNNYTISIPIGQYSATKVKPTCGLVSEKKIIGIMDDPRYFADPEHVSASLLWFANGFIEYSIPNFVENNKKYRSLEISFEICSEAPGYNENWPSDIYFYLNNELIGRWTCPGDFGSTHGVFTPVWWTGTQYGLLKRITVDVTGSFIDGVRISDKTINNFNISYAEAMTFRIESREVTENPGGVSLFGKNFGNYNQDILVTVRF